MLLWFNVARFSCESPGYPVAGIVWCVSASQTLLSDFLSDLPLCLCCRELEKQNIIPADLLKLTFVFVYSLPPGSQASHPSRISLPLHNLKFSSFISLFLFFRPPRFSRTWLRPSTRSTPVGPSQDKHALYWSMSAICSKRIWMPFRPGSPRGGKLTNLVLFHNPFLCFSFFLVGAPLFFLQTLTTSSLS